MLTVALLLATALRRRPRLSVLLGAAVAAGLLFTFSRSSLIALAAGLVVLGFLQWRWSPVAAAAVTIGVSIAWVHVFPSIAPTGRFTRADLTYQRENARQHPGASFSPTSGSEPSIREHLRSLRDGARTVIHHQQGFGLGNAGQTASRTGTPIKAGESNYTEMGAEMGILGSVLWTVWVVALLAALIRAARRSRWWAVVQTDVIGDPWMGYVLWLLAGLTLSMAMRPMHDERASGVGVEPITPPRKRGRIAYR